jgi:hypothetical protein
MKARLHYRRVVLRLPVMPRRFPRGDKRNYRRWHAWVEAVKALARWSKAQG